MDLQKVYFTIMEIFRMFFSNNDTQLAGLIFVIISVFDLVLAISVSLLKKSTILKDLINRTPGKHPYQALVFIVFSVCVIQVIGASIKICYLFSLSAIISGLFLLIPNTTYFLLLSKTFFWVIIISSIHLLLSKATYTRNKHDL